MLRRNIGSMAELPSPLHSWDVAPIEAVRLQEELRPRIKLEPIQGPIRRIAGADISFERHSDLFHAVWVILEFPELRLIEVASASVRSRFPYVPGLLSFREAPALLAAWKNIRTIPDVLFMDGQGIAHPRGMGIASHLGLWLDRPAIGCGKSRLFGAFEPPGPEPGLWTPLTHRSNVIGAVLRTKARSNPLFISPGHRIDVASSIALVRQALNGYRVPEPTRLAHIWANRVRIEAKKEIDRSPTGT